jgi:hypothetical protein
MAGGWIAEHLVSTDLSAWLGAVVGWTFGVVLWRRWEEE